MTNPVSPVDNNTITCLLESQFLDAGTQVASIEDYIEPTISCSSTIEVEITQYGDYVNVSNKINECQMEQHHELIQTDISALSINGQHGITSMIEHDIELVEQSKLPVEQLLNTADVLPDKRNA